ncbi:hydrolase 1, exosortase A system-associated [Pseudorhodoferax sp.]|uniref:hydrolase 1, exosortase A system-associated n=1 Tax=Pseudorhodoferax sp. TaxID=1993553 RepID=UPI002DD6A2AD|nr:hydrolase 1, exosortase A system-associated [Pseudorhodoferax sp.]
MTPGFTERPLTARVGDDTLIGILAEPATPARRAVLVIVGGPQYRAGSHRQFVTLCRQLAAAGVAALRFDVRGMGDSLGTPRSFEAIDDDIGAMAATLRLHCPQLEHLVLWGLCDGASAALMYCDSHADHGIAGLVLLNPWIRTPASQARTRVKHYYTRRLRDPAFWRKLLHGGVGLAALRDAVRNLAHSRARRPQGQAAAAATRVLPYPDRMARAWHAFQGPIALILSGNDYTAKEFLEYTASAPDWQQALAGSKMLRTDIATADHTFSRADDAAQATRASLALLARLD